jgi:hypothetical protein
MKKLIILTLFAFLLTSCGTVTETEELIEETELPTVEDTEEAVVGPEFQAELTSVDGGVATGVAMASVYGNGGSYLLTAGFTDLPEVEDGFFYEGWVVRTEGELSVISTGVVEDSMNFYTNNVDLSDHTQYILTLEPDDGDPAPADHVMEGTFIRN